MQVAITHVLNNYNKPRIRSNFKKNIYSQVITHLENETNEYTYPFSKKCACMILEL